LAKRLLAGRGSCGTRADKHGPGTATRSREYAPAHEGDAVGTAPDFAAPDFAALDDATRPVALFLSNTPCNSELSTCEELHASHPIDNTKHRYARRRE
jgi:hypothetical protein